MAMDMLSDSHPSAAGLRDLAPDGPFRRRRAPSPRGLGVSVLAGLAGLGALLAAAWTGHEAAASDAERRLQGAATVLARGAEDALAPAEALAAGIAARLQADGIASAEALRRWATARPVQDALRERATRGLRAVALLDGEGQPIGAEGEAGAAGGPLPGAVQALRGGAARVLGGAVPDLATGGWTLRVAQRLSAADGSLLGVLIAAVELPRLGGVQAAAGPGAALTLLTEDGTALLRHPPEAAGLPRAWLVASGSAGALGARAELSWRGLALAWRGPLLALGAGAMLVLLLAAGGAAAALRRAREAALAESDRRATAVYLARLEGEAFEQERRHGRELQAQQAAVQATVESMSQGLVTFGRHARLTVANSRCAEVIGLPLEALRPGATLPDLIAAARQAQRLGAARALEQLLPLVIRREPAAFLHELGRARRVLVVHRPLPDGGWLATFDDATAQEAAERRLTRMAQHDALTGLRNIAWLRERLAGLLAGAETSGAAAALLHVNLDRFRSVNEALGYAMGDALLRGVARRIEDTVRRGRGGEVVRLGADEFAVVVSAASSGRAGDPGHEAASLAERIVSALGKPFEVEGYRVVTGASVGIALFPSQGRNADELLTHAALAMRRAKGGSRGGHAFYATEMAAQAGARRLLELELRLALTEGSGRAFELQCEPVLDVLSRRVVGLEATLRWHHSVHGLVPHDILAALGADLGLSAPLGRMLPRRAVAALAGWPDTLRAGIGFSVTQLLEPGLVERLEAMLAEAGLAPQRLEILVTEPELRQAPHLVLDTLHRLRGLGLRVTLDEFGASGASPWSLRAFPFDRVRLTRALVRELGGRNHGLEIVRALMALARQHGIPVIAPGIETEEQLALLAAERCAQAQGPLFGAQVPADGVPALLQRLGAPAPVANDFHPAERAAEMPAEARAS